MEITTQDRLKQIMEERNLRQKDIFDLAQPYCQMYGERLGLADISAYVTGKYLPAQKKLTLLGKALNVSEAWLMGLDVPRERTDQPIECNDGREKEFLLLFRQLSEEEQLLLIRQMRGLLADQ